MEAGEIFLSFIFLVLQNENVSSSFINCAVVLFCVSEIQNNESSDSINTAEFSS